MERNTEKNKTLNFATTRSRRFQVSLQDTKKCRSESFLRVLKHKKEILTLIFLEPWWLPGLSVWRRCKLLVFANNFFDV